MGALNSTLVTRNGSFKTVNPSEIVELKAGKVRGKTFSNSDYSVDCYLGIPFGKPPVGELRFQKPVPADPWEGVLDCSRFGPRCHHKDELYELPSVILLLPPKSEDCLRLNVFVPRGDGFQEEDSAAGGRPVLVFIHGGGFSVHSAAHYGDVGICSTICRKGLIVVTIQYRLGFFGFLSTNDEVAPGNAGLYDQALALKWINENISSFGGNPGNVTVCGQSAGGASADLLSISPISRDYFQKVVPMGGNASCDFAIGDAERVRNACLNFAQELGFKMDGTRSMLEESEELVKFMREVPCQQLQLGIFGRKGHSINKGKLDLIPVVGEDFLPKSVAELRKEAPKKECMVGATRYEGLLFVAMLRADPTVAHIEHTIRHQLHIGREVNNAEIDELVKKILSVYVDDESDPKKLMTALVRILGDSVISHGLPQYAKEMSSKNTVYFYSFDYDRSARFGLASYMMPFTAATHGTELPYLLGKGVVANFRPDAEDRQIVEKFTTFFANFCRYGNPNGTAADAEQQWEAVSEDPYRYFSIDESCEMKADYEGRTSQMWIDAFETVQNLKSVSL